MAKLQDVLRKLNKGKAEEDKYSGVVGDRKIERKFLSTGSPFIDKLTGGGFVKGAYNSIVGAGGAGKTSISLLACAEATNNGDLAVFIDGEATVEDSYIDRMGINRDFFIHERIRNLEEMLNYAEAMSTIDDVAVIVMDSIPIFTSTAAENKSADEYTMADEARRFSQRMCIIEGNCIKRDIAIIGLTSYKVDLSIKMGDNRTLPRGKWQIQMMNTFLDVTRKSFISGKDDIPIGHEIDVRIKKAKTGAYDTTKAYRLNFYYDRGFDKIEQICELALKADLVEKSGAWIRFKDHEGEDQQVQGKASFMEYMQENKDCADYYNSLLQEDKPIFIEGDVDLDESNEGEG